MQPFNLRQRPPPVFSDVEMLIRLHQVDQPVKNALSFLYGRLVHPDVHPAIHLARIGRQHFGAQSLCQVDGNLTLTHGSRTKDDNERLGARGER